MPPSVKLHRIVSLLPPNSRKEQPPLEVTRLKEPLEHLSRLAELMLCLLVMVAIGIDQPFYSEKQS